MRDELTRYEEHISSDSSAYLMEAADFAARNGFWNEDDYNNLQMQLWTLMQKQTKRFTMGDSSSIPLEEAEELKKSVYFCIGIYCKKNGSVVDNIQLLKNTSLSEIFEKGQKEVIKLVGKGKKLLQMVHETVIDIGNISYSDTVNGLVNFFINYDVKLMAHDIPCMIDYQLSKPVPELYGIEYFNEYLQSLLIENWFCKGFPIENIEAILRVGCFDYRQDLINIFEFVFNNAMGLAMLDKDVCALDISDGDRLDLLNLVMVRDVEWLRKHMEQSLDKVLAAMDLDYPIYKNYYAYAASELLNRMEGLKEFGFENLFMKC